MSTKLLKILTSHRHNLYLLALLACSVGAPASAQVAASSTPYTPSSPPRVTVVLAGGGAKGYAHLALLRRLEQDHVPISKIIGTSMGAVIGSLYASGMSTDRIEKVIASLDPGRVALDQLDRSELPQRTRDYQQRYPIELELGVKNGQLSFARGVSDGQRFLSLMQELTANVPPNSSFDNLPIPFRAIATRYRDGELVSFDHGTLALAVRASMAAPGVFAPVEVEGETYVDGGLVANLAVEEALREGADIIVASYLGDTDRVGDTLTAGNALSVATRMLDILMRQNERRNIAMLRPQDILVRPQLQDYSFGSFDQPDAIIQAGQDAVLAQDERFRHLAQLTAQATVAGPAAPDFMAHPVTLNRLRITGNHDVPATVLENALQPLIGHVYQPAQVNELIDGLYASGNFERLSYTLEHLQLDQYTLVLEVNEKPYGPNFVKTSLAFYSESSGDNLFSVGVGFRRPWLTPSGLELQVDMRVGSRGELRAAAFQPLSDNWGLNGYLGYNISALPLYRQDVSTPQLIASTTLRRTEAGIDLSYDIGRKATARIGVITNETSVSIDTARKVSFPLEGGGEITYQLPDAQLQFTGLNTGFSADLLDSHAFPTRGYYLNVEAAAGNSGSVSYDSYRANLLWAASLGAHVFNLGLDLGADHLVDCANCARLTSLTPLYLGGFQAMGAYQMGQLNGDRLAHLQGTYMYRLSDGGILRQPTYVGLVSELGDAWNSTASYSQKYSNTAFIGVDSKIGDIFFGAASGSGGNRNMFLQLGRRFTLW